MAFAVHVEIDVLECCSNRKSLQSNQASGVRKPPPHSTVRRFRYAHTSQIFSKRISNRRGSVDNHTICGLDASSTLPLRFCYVLTTAMKIRLPLVYTDGDAAATLLRPRRWSYAFVALLYPFCIKSEVQLIYVQLSDSIRYSAAGHYEHHYEPRFVPI